MRTYSVEWNFKGHGWFEVEAETREQAIEIIYNYDNQKFIYLLKICFYHLKGCVQFELYLVLWQ